MAKVEIPELKEFGRQITELAAKVERLTPQKMWYSRQDLADLKGIPVSAFYNKPWLLPGQPSKQGGTDRWSYQQVFESGWIWMTDADLRPRSRRRA